MLKRLTNLGLKLFAQIFPSKKPLLFTGIDSTTQLATHAPAAARPARMNELTICISFMDVRFRVKISLITLVEQKHLGCSAIANELTPVFEWQFFASQFTANLTCLDL